MAPGRLGARAHLGMVRRLRRTRSWIITIAEYTFDNPVPWSPLGRPPLSYVTPNWNGPATVLLTFLGFGLLVAAAAAPFVRWRGANTEGRLQLRWFAYATAATALTGVLAAVVAGVAPDVAGWLATVPLAGAAIAIPVAVGIGVLKYRLYRSTSWSTRPWCTRGWLRSSRSCTSESWSASGRCWAPAIDPTCRCRSRPPRSPVAFQPVRARMQRFANHLVYGKRATPYEVLSEFSERVGDAYATDDLMPRMPSPGGRNGGSAQRRVARREWSTSPGGIVAADRNGPRSAVTRAIPGRAVSGAPPRGAARRPVRREATRPESMTWPRDGEEEARGGPRSAGLVLGNVRLTEALLERLEELKASRLRLVAAQDEERRKLERNLHDGAQQQLVALSVKARLAQQLARRPEQVEAILGQIQADTGDALENLRDLARGIYPPLLADQGLVAALEAQARKAVLPTTVTGNGVGRFDQDIEAAVYFSCLEALQNVAKYAEASRIDHPLQRRRICSTFTVADDGRGFDPDSTGYGTGLQGIADRLAALDGRVEVTSANGGRHHRGRNAPHGGALVAPTALERSRGSFSARSRSSAL